MSDWKTVALGDLVEPAKTWNPSRSAPTKVFDYIDLSAVEQDTKLIVGARELSCSEAPSRARQLVAKGDILVSTVRPNLNGVAKVPEELDGATASTGFCVLHPRPALLDGGYIFHWVKTPRFVADMVNKATGASYPAVSDRIVFESRLPLPPLAEQRQIAEVLDRAEALRAKRRAALVQLDTLIQSIFLDLFGDSATNPKGWPKVQLGDIALYVSSGVTPPGGSAVYQQSGVLFIRSQNVLMNEFDFSDIAYVSDELHGRMRRTWVKNGDVLINITGASIGRVHYFTGRDDTANVNQHVCIIRLDRARAIPEFMSHYLSKPTYQRIILGRNAGATRQAFNFQQIRQFSIALPPLALQREFAHRIAAVAKLKTAHRASLAKLDALFASLQHHAFRGEL